MHPDGQYEHALSAALVILNEFDRLPDMGRHTRLALVVFSILHAMNQWDDERRELHTGFSVN
jgi:hypothetical protein